MTQAEAASLEYIESFVIKKPMMEREPAKDYWLPKVAAKDEAVAIHRAKVREHILSEAFKQRVEELKSQTDHERGIVMSAGGRYYLPQAIVLLRVLRHHLNSTLPVELFWHGDKEMDDASLQSLKKEFGPLEGYDVTKLPYPAHHRAGAKIVGFPMKPYALLHSKFKHAMLLDCDVVPARDPSYMFDSPEYREHGNMFWSDIYSEGMVKMEAYDYVGVNRSVHSVVLGGKGDFPRYAESGQLMVDRTRHLDVLEWVWFLNSFGDGHIYNFMYGDKDTYSLGFAIAGKAHMYQQLNVPPGGVFTQLHMLGWQPKKEQMNKQGNWWLHALVHYDTNGEALLFHRVTGEVKLGGGTPTDEVITPPIPISWSMWFMGYGPTGSLQRTLEVLPLNVTYMLASAPAGQACPVLAWGAYWTMRTHSIPVDRLPGLESSCSSEVPAQYGPRGAALIRRHGLVDHPSRLVINAKWDEKVNGGWNAPKFPLLAVPLNMTAGHGVWRNMDAALSWANKWAPASLPVLGNSSRRRRLLEEQWQRRRQQRRHLEQRWRLLGGSGGGA